MRTKITAVLGSLLLACNLAWAVTLRVADVGDVITVDPHAQSESLHASFTENFYEPLVGRDKNMKIEPVLATDWVRSSPLVWRFNLRRGVRFHDGRPFNADDVVFSLGRAAANTSARKFSTASFRQVRKVDDHAVEIETLAPLSVLPDMISNVPIMSKSWCELHKAVVPSDRRSGVPSDADFMANGTGPFILKERRPDLRTTLVRNLKRLAGRKLIAAKNQGRAVNYALTADGRALLASAVPLWRRAQSDIARAVGLTHVSSRPATSSSSIAYSQTGNTPNLAGIIISPDGRLARIDTGISRYYNGPVSWLEILGDRMIPHTVRRSGQ